MPKDKNLAKHKSRFEVRGGVMNEFEFEQGHGALTEEERDRFARQEEERGLRESESEQSPQVDASRVEQLIMEAREKALKNLRRKGKESGNATSRPARRRGGAKKSPRPAAKTALRKTEAKKAGAKKASGKKAASKARSGKRAAKKDGAGKAGKKGAARKGGTRGR